MNRSNRVRCAIYTRKSTDEGLAREFNTLDAQRESAEAYIQSQRDQGWVPMQRRYDDGGFSGGHTDRPALQQMLADVQAGSIDCVVVYKVDRLSRSLVDFAKLLLIFEQHDVSFVAVTQQINTASSAGRLMLNVLLSFAQFERELIAERTRDKMGAARRKGKWLGGQPVLGYDVDREQRKLVTNPAEAERVRQIFRDYLAANSLREVVDVLQQRGWCKKVWLTKGGEQRGGRKFTKATLQYLLRNVTYRGKVRYRDKLYPGEHEAIVDLELFEQVQRKLQANRTSQRPIHRHSHRALLHNRLFCSLCEAKMVHTYTQKGKRRYRYYVCPAERGNAHGSIPAAAMESYVREQVNSTWGIRSRPWNDAVLRVEYHPDSGDLRIEVDEEFV